MAKHFDVVVVGELNIDLILNKMDTLPVVGKEILADQMTLTLGSSSAIFASNLQTLGASVTYIGKVGKDNFGSFIINSLKSNNVDTSNIICSSQHNSGATIVLNFDEDRAMVTYPGAMNHLTINDIDDTTLLNANHLHLSSFFLQKGLKSDVYRLFKKAKALGLTTSIDPQWDPDEEWDMNLEELLQYVDIFLPNAVELMALTKTQDLESAINTIKHFKNTIIIIKNGNKGAYLWNGEELIHQAPFLNEKVIDSIGAGDSFDAGFIYKFLQKKSLKECLEFGALTGAINTTHHGGTGAFESMELVKTIAQSAFDYAL